MKNLFEKLGIHLSPRFFKILWISLVSFVVISIISIIGMSHYLTSPSFCKSCHIMKPYYNAWATSKHNFVPCVDCHYPPSGPKTLLWKKFQALSQVAKYVTRTYSSKPFAEIEDTSCLRGGCHSTRLLQGKVVTEKGVTFDHRPHLEGVKYGRKLRCVSCHSQIVVGNHIEVTWNTCYLCHFKGKVFEKSMPAKKADQNCLRCHSLPDKPIKSGNISYSHKEFLGKHNVSCKNCHQDVVQGSGDVSKDRCLTCHNQPEKLSRYNETDFIHDNHVTKHNTACIHCHEEMKHSATAAGTKTLSYDCSMCHENLHDLQRNIYKGTGAINIPSMPSPMYLANVDCVGCHAEKKPVNAKVSNATTLRGSEKGCIVCHSEKYTGILDDVHEKARETILKLEDKLAKLKKSSASSTRSKELDEISYNLNFVKSAHSIHNIYYSAQILRDIDNKLNLISKDVNFETEDLSSLPIISGSFCATLCHAKVGVQVPSEKVRFNGKTMPHRKHFENGLACTECHTFGVHKDVKLKSPTICKNCH